MPVEQVDKGSYILLINFPAHHNIVVGKLGKIHFNSGWYAYVGSAMGGFRKRLPRYLNKVERLHWHIDYLLELAPARRILVYATNERLECRIAGMLREVLESVPGFGCSDCLCKSHLFYSPTYRKLKSGLRNIQSIQPGLVARDFGRSLLR